MEGQGGALGCLRIVKLRVVHLIEAVLAKQTADRPKPPLPRTIQSCLTPTQQARWALKPPCLIVESDGGHIVIPAFPYNEVTWNGVTFSWEDASFEVGEHVRFAGGYTSSAPNFVTIPHSCDASGDYFIAHSLA